MPREGQDLVINTAHIQLKNWRRTVSTNRDRDCPGDARVTRARDSHRGSVTKGRLNVTLMLLRRAPMRGKCGHRSGFSEAARGEPIHAQRRDRQADHAPATTMRTPALNDLFIAGRTRKR
jgi:hypothetical protein